MKVRQINICKRVEVERKAFDKKDGILYFFHIGEHHHNLMHVHAKYQKYEASIGLKPIKLLRGELIPIKKQREAILYVKHNQKKLIKAWTRLATTDIKHIAGTPMIKEQSLQVRYKKRTPQIVRVTRHFDLKQTI